MLLDLEALLIKYQLKIDGALHVGAHVGSEKPIYDRLGIPEENQHYFEPQPHVFETLKKNVGSNVHLYPFALGNENKKVTMQVEYDNASQSSSILQPLIHLRQYPHIRFTNQIEVDLFKLDDVIEKYNIKKELNWFLSLDCQGFELEVLKGGAGILPYVTAIICEINNAPVYQGCPMYTEIDNYLREFGLIRKEQNWEGGTWGDGFYCRFE